MTAASLWFRRGLVVCAVCVAAGLVAPSYAADDEAKGGAKEAAGKAGTAAAKAGGVEALAREGYWGKDDTWKDHSKLLGKPAPKLQLTNWVGKEIKPADMKGRVLVVDYWATWCGPCIASIPHNNEVAKRYADKGVLVIGACGGGGEERMPELARKHGIEYPVARVSEESTKAWGVRWWPTYAVVDRGGNVRAIGIKPDYVEKVVDAILKEQPAEPRTATAD